MGKLTEIKGKLRRRIVRRDENGAMDDLVIEVQAEGIRLRKYTQRGVAFIRWDQLLKHFPRPTGNRPNAFYADTPAGWIPERGDRVWIHPEASPRFKRGVVTCVIDAVGGPIIGVRVGTRTTTEQFRLSELRPST